MPMRFREDKTTQAASLLLQLHKGKMEHMKLIKLLYLADREALIRWGRPLTFDWYVSMTHGPVLSFTYDLIKSPPEFPGYWNQHITPGDAYQVKLKKAAPADQLSRAEEDLLREVYAKFGGMNQWKIVDYLHTLPEWHDPEGSSSEIRLEDILRAGNHDEEDIRHIQDALEAEAAAIQTLASE